MQGGGQMVSISHRNIRGGQQHSWWAATSAVGSDIRGGQQHLWWAATSAVWAATSVVGRNIRGG